MSLGLWFMLLMLLAVEQTRKYSLGSVERQLAASRKVQRCWTGLLPPVRAFHSFNQSCTQSEEAWGEIKPQRPHGRSARRLCFVLTQTLTQQSETEIVFVVFVVFGWNPSIWFLMVIARCLVPSYKLPWFKHNSRVWMCVLLSVGMMIDLDK